MAIPTRLLGFTFALPSLIACCAVSPNAAPSILKQQNVIVWDPKTKTEHFIRQAAFETETEDFGFIVATPSLPKVSEVSTSILTTASGMDPEVQELQYEYTQKGYDSAPAAADASVDVLQVEDAGAYTITTLSASNSASLENWLRSNQYKLPQDIQEWLDGYVAKKWLFSAFKFKSDRVELMGKLPCLTFKTDEPFAPYRVPKSNRTKTESLDVYFISDQPYGGFVRNERQNIDKWCSRVRNHHSANLGSAFEYKVQIPAGWVASYMKTDFPTDAAEDMIFRPVEKNIFEKPGGNMEILALPIVPIAGVAAVAGIAWYALRKRRA